MRSFCLNPKYFVLMMLFCVLFFRFPVFAGDIEIDLGGSSNTGTKTAPTPTQQVKVPVSHQVADQKSSTPKPLVGKKEFKKPSDGTNSIVNKVFVSPVENETEVRIDGEGLPQPSLVKISGNKLLIKFVKTRLKIPLKIKGDDKVVKSIRSSVHTGQTAWIVVDLLKGINSSLEKTGTGYSLILGSSEGSSGKSKPILNVNPEADNEKTTEKGLYSRLIDASLKPVEKGMKIVLTSDGMSKYTVRKLVQPTKLVMRFHDTKLDVAEKMRSIKGSDEELKKGGLLGMELRQIGPAFSPISEAILTLLPGTIYQIDRDLNQVVITLTAPPLVEKPLEKRGNLNQLVSLDIEDADINAVVKTLSTEAGFDVDFVSGPLMGEVNEKFRDVPLKTALATLLSPGGFDFEVQGNTIRFGSQTALKASKNIMPHVTEIITPAGGMTPGQLKTLVESVLKPTNAVTTQVDTVRNVLVLSGTPSDIDDYKKAIRDLKLDEGTSGDRITRVVKLNYSDPAELMNILKEYLTPVGKISVDTASDSLVIWETASNMGVLLELIKELDHKLPQVLIESSIVEVDNENDLNLGMNLSATRSSGDPTMGVSFDNPPTGVGAIPGSIAFGTIKNGLNVMAQLQALETKNKGKIISRPRIATASGVPAEINEVENVVVSSQTQNVSQNGFVTYTTTYTNFPLPIDLKVTPRITDDGRITTVINASITSQSGPATPSGLPPTNVQTATTTITTKNGETIVIGGLVREVAQDSVNGIPLLSSIPIIGTLFQERSKTNRKEELIIFITPTILED